MENELVSEDRKIEARWLRDQDILNKLIKLSSIPKDDNGFYKEDIPSNLNSGSFPANVLEENYTKWIKDKNNCIKRYIPISKEIRYTEVLSNYNLKEENKINLIWDENLKDYEEQEKEWIVEKLIPTKSVCILTGKRGTMKTFLTLNMIYSIASGNCFLNKYSTRKGKIIYLDKENGIGIIKQRVSMIKKGMEIEDNPLPVAFICFSQLKIDNLSDVSKIEDVIKEQNPLLLVVDTYRRGISFDENDAGEVSKLFVDTLRPLVEKYDLSIILIHHNRKGSGESGDEMDELRGSSDLANYADIILKIERKGNNLVLKQLKNRNMQEEEPMKINLDITDDSIKMWYEGEFIKRNLSERFMEDIIMWATELKVKTFETKDIKELAFVKGVKKNNMHNALIVLQDKGIIECLSKGRYKFNSLFSLNQQIKQEV